LSLKPFFGKAQSLQSQRKFQSRFLGKIPRKPLRKI
jgi:hypothetical protein